MRHGRPLIASRTFRIILIYLFVLSLALGGLLGLVYWSTTAAVSRQIETTIDAELRGLAEQFRQRGVLGLSQAIERRSAQNADDRALYLLTDAQFRCLPSVEHMLARVRQHDGAEGWYLLNPAG